MKYINTIDNKIIIVNIVYEYYVYNFKLYYCISKYLLFEVDLLRVYTIDSRINIIYYTFTLFS